MNYHETLKEIEKLMGLSRIAMELFYLRSSNPIYGEDKNRDVHIHIYNFIIYQYEIIISYYKSIINKYSPGNFEIQDYYPDVLERLNYIQTTAFIKTVSSIEYVFKQWLVDNESIGANMEKLFKKGSPTFGMIVKAMKKDNYLPVSILKMLEDINYLRNCIVHSDSISNHNKSIKIGSAEIRCERGAEIRFGILDLTYLSIKLIEALDEFYCKVLDLPLRDDFPECTASFDAYIDDIYNGKITFEDLGNYMKT